jgi:hypothetical protein
MIERNNAIYPASRSLAENTPWDQYVDGFEHITRLRDGEAFTIV